MDQSVKPSGGATMNADERVRRKEWMRAWMRIGIHGNRCKSWEKKIEKKKNLEKLSLIRK